MADYTPERWAAITEILGEALERPAEARAAFLDEACSGTPELRAEVERLLAAHGEAEAAGRFEAGATDLIEGLFPDSVPAAEIGPYKLIQEVGRGGMGRVWLAERTDGVYEQRVAIKVMHAGHLGDEDRRRFEAERRILARLDHPNVARIIDGGITPDGQSYLVMEFVDGEPITEYCERRGVPLSGRVVLMRTVCDAVAYAHGKLVVHRDLKPSNVLVSSDGTVKLLDFGIAKLLADDEHAEHPLTVTGTMRLTPEYAAPEQVTGDPITTATDVYSLGVVLFELLTGRRPYAFTSRTPTAIEQVVCHTRPSRPSATAEEARRARRLRGDLDTIVLKALRKEPERRYASAAEFAEDLRRHQVQLPVSARPDSFRYHSSKFIRRHRVGVGAVASIGLALVAALLISTVQTRVATEEREKAEAVNQFLVELLAAPDPREQGREVRVASLLDQADATVAERFGGRPAIEAQIRQTLGVTYRELGLLAEAETQLRRALSLREQLHRAGHREVLASQEALGTVLLAQGQHEEARAILESALASARRGQNDHTLPLRDLLSSLGYVYYRMGDLERSLALHSEAVSVAEAHPEANLVEVAASLGNVAIALADLGRLEEAVSLMERQLGIYRDAFADDNTRIARALTNLASVYLELDRTEDALSAAEEAVTLFQHALDPDHPDLAWGLGTLGNAQFRSSDPRAHATLTASLEAYERAFGVEHPRTASALLRLAQWHLRNEQPADARMLLIRADRIAAAADFDVSHPLRERIGDALTQAEDN